jgi:hypothetical protein
MTPLETAASLERAFVRRVVRRPRVERLDDARYRT